MRWKKLTADQFGPMIHWEADTDKNLVVFLGRNEAGKSTVMELTQGLLFGYTNLKELRRRLIRRGASQAVISGELELSDGSTVGLQRTIRESGTTGVCTREGTSASLNGVYPPVASLGRELMHSTYALSQDELKFPSAAEWKRVQNLLLSGQVDPRLVPFSEAEAKLKDRVLNIWRPDRRGNPRWNDYIHSRETLEQEETAAIDRQRQMDTLHRENENDALLQVQADTRKGEAEAFLKLGEEENRLNRQLTALETRAEAAAEADIFNTLPRELSAVWQSLLHRREQQEKASRALEGELAEAALRRERAASPIYKNVLANRELLELIPGTRVRLDEETHTLRSLEGEKTVAWVRLELQLSDTFADDTGREKLQQLEGDTLQQCCRAEIDGRQALATAQQEAAEAPARARRRTRALRVLSWVVLGLGAACLVPGILGLVQNDLRGWYFVIPGMVLLAAEAVLLPVQAAIEKRVRRQADTHLADCEAAYSTAVAAAEAALQGCNLQKTLTDNPENIPGALEACRKAVAAYAEAEEAITRADRQLRLRQKELLEAVQLVLPDREPDEAAFKEVSSLLEQAVHARYEADKAEEALPSLKAREKQLAEEAEALETEQKALWGGLAFATGENAAEKIAYVNRVREEHRQAKKELAAFEERQPGIIQRLHTLRQHWPYTEAALEEAAVRVASCEQEARATGARQAGRTEALRNLESRELPSAVAARKAQLGEEMEEVRLERDRDVVTLALLRLANRRFREENQPRLIQKASGLLDTITGGRYDRLALTEDGQGLLVRLSETGEWLNPEKDRLSRGTLEQLYICFRLAQCEQLDPEEPLPICLDETLVNWDADRIRRGLSVIRDIARERQVFLFTCHPWMVALLREQSEDFGYIEI